MAEIVLGVLVVAAILISAINLAGVQDVKSSVQDVKSSLEKAATSLEEAVKLIRELGAATPAKPSLLDYVAKVAPPPEGYVAIALPFEPQKVHAHIEIYEVSPTAKHWDTQSFPTTDLSQIPLLAQPVKKVGKEVEFEGKHVQVVYMKLGESKLLALVVVNHEEHEGRFIAVPHIYDPALAAAGVILKCFCTGETYIVPAKGTWVRIIQIDVTKDFKPGTVVSALHPLTPGTHTH